MMAVDRGSPGRPIEPIYRQAMRVFVHTQWHNSFIYPVFPIIHQIPLSLRTACSVSHSTITATNNDALTMPDTFSAYTSAI